MVQVNCRWLAEAPAPGDGVPGHQAVRGVEQGDGFGEAPQNDVPDPQPGAERCIYSVRKAAGSGPDRMTRAIERDSIAFDDDRIKDIVRECARLRRRIPGAHL